MCLDTPLDFGNHCGIRRHWLLRFRSQAVEDFADEMNSFVHAEPTDLGDVDCAHVSNSTSLVSVSNRQQTGSSAVNRDVATKDTAFPPAVNYVLNNGKNGHKR